MTTNHPKTPAAAALNNTANRFFSLIDWNMPTTPKIAIKPKITINKFMKIDTPFDITFQIMSQQYSSLIVNVS